MSVILTLYPASTADSSDFPPNGATAHGVLADSSDSNYISKQAYAGETHSAYGSTITQMPTTGISAIVSVTPNTRVGVGGARENSGASIYGGFISGGTFYDAFTQNKNRGVDDFPDSFSAATGTAYTTNPNGGAAWTPTSVNALGWRTGGENYHFDGDVFYVSYLAFELSLTLNAPIPVTTAASNITISSATLNGTLDPNGASTTYPVSYYFQWGLTTAYGNNTTIVSGVTGSGASEVSANISGLVGTTTYHYRLVASNAEGTVNGSDQIFVTGVSDSIVFGF